MIRVALKMLRGEPGKYGMPPSGICFSAILMALGMGVIRLNNPTPTNIRAPIWGARLGDHHPLRDLAGAAGMPSRIVRPGDEAPDQTLADLVEAGGESKRSAHLSLMPHEKH